MLSVPAPVLGAVLVTASAPVALAALRRICPRRARFQRIAMRALAAALAMAYAVLGAEMTLRCFFVESNGAGVTLASQRWLDTYWKPINSLGFRDHEVSADELAGKRIVWVVGDSYAAGWGIEDIRDRFSDRLASALGGNWRVLTIAKPGWDTRRQIEAVTKFPHRPDAIIHAYCLNDAERAAEDAGLRIPRVPTAPESSLGRLIVEHSHLANLLYWRWRNLAGQEVGERYWDFIAHCYTEGPPWNTHAADLESLLDLYRARTDHVIAFVIPNLLNIETSRPMTRRLEDWFAAHGVDCIRLSDSLAGRNPRDLTVNRFDPHASVSLHALIADLLLAPIEKP